MKTSFALVAAVSAPLILGSAGAFAGELSSRPTADDHTVFVDHSALAQSNGGRDWSASIGNGHTTSNTAVAPSTAGSPSSAHWSASIGTGQVSGDSTQRQAVPANVTGVTHVATSQVPTAHWTSKIGTAHAVDSNKTAQNGKSPS